MPICKHCGLTLANWHQFRIHILTSCAVLHSAHQGARPALQSAAGPPSEPALQSAAGLEVVGPDGNANTAPVLQSSVLAMLQRKQPAAKAPDPSGSHGATAACKGAGGEISASDSGLPNGKGTPATQGPDGTAQPRETSRGRRRSRPSDLDAVQGMLQAPAPTPLAQST